MRYIVLLFAVYVFSVSSVFAVTPTSTPSAALKDKEATSSAKSSSSSAKLDQSAQDIKDTVEKIAKKNLQQQKAVSGEIIETQTGSYKIKSTNDDEYTVKIDSTLTKAYQVSGTQKKDMKLADIKKGNYIIVTGPLTDKVVNANTIYLDEEYFVKTGKVTEINKDDNFIKVLTTDKDTYTLDVDTSSKLQLMDSKTFDVDTVKFAKIKEGDTVHFVVKKTGTERENNRYTLQKVLIIPQEFFIK